MEEHSLNLKRYSEAADPDAVLKEQLEISVSNYKGSSTSETSSSDSLPLKIFLAGYAGAGNTGADVRVYEMLRQFRHFWGENVDFCLSVIEPQLAQFFEGMTEIRELVYLPEFLPAMTDWADISVACEGSLFKSNFGDVLSFSMIATLAYAKSAGQLSFAYGSEAGSMSDELLSFTRKFCQDTRVFCRNRQSVERLAHIGMDVSEGVDTAWTYEPQCTDWAREELIKTGWDGQQPLLAVCPVNPFFWPVRADQERYQAFLKDGSHAESHYGYFYFHEESAEITEQFEAYLNSVRQAVETWASQHHAHVVLIGMDRVDKSVVSTLSEQLSVPHSAFTSPEYSQPQLISLLRISNLMLSSRFHAIVCTMSAGLPCVGLDYDDRISNLLTDAGHPELVFPVSPTPDPVLLTAALNIAWEQRSIIENDHKAFAVRQLVDLGKMGQALCELVKQSHPELPCRIISDDPLAYLPPLSDELTQLLTCHVQ
ncbi:MAG: polysaccharide pyruvyl transferase family protein [Akkermansiaceae bacterium]